MPGASINFPSQSAPSRWYTGFLTLLLGCLAATPSLADSVSLPQDEVITPWQAIDMDWGHHLRRDNFLLPGPVTQGQRNACFAIGEAAEERSKPGRRHGEPALPLPAMSVCVGLVSEVDGIGWSGYEAKGDHAKPLGRWAEAEQAYAKAVELLEQTIGHEANQDLATLLNKLGVVRFMQSDFTGAGNAIRRALAIYTSTRRADDLRMADTLDLLACTLFEQEQERALAGPLFFRAWLIREASLEPNHPAIADSLHHVAISLYANDLSYGIRLFQRAKEIREKVYGRDHPLVAISLSAMAHMYEAHNQRDLAIPLYQDALRIQEKAFGSSAAATLQARDYLDMAYREKPNQGNDPNGRK